MSIVPVVTMVESSEQRLTKVKGNDQVLDKKEEMTRISKCGQLWGPPRTTRRRIHKRDTESFDRTPVTTLCYMCLLTPLYIKEKDLIQSGSA